MLLYRLDSYTYTQILIGWEKEYIHCAWSLFLNRAFFTIIVEALWKYTSSRYGVLCVALINVNTDTSTDRYWGSMAPFFFVSETLCTVLALSNSISIVTIHFLDNELWNDTYRQAAEKFNQSRLVESHRHATTMLRTRKQQRLQLNERIHSQ